jgi:hypothetical protein
VSVSVRVTRATIWARPLRRGAPAATGAGDDASVLADEVRARLADNARELAELNEPGASPP